MKEEETINISAINQYAYCPRRCGLIYLENEFSDNIYTLRGNAEHERVDQAGHIVARDGAKVEYALPVWSDLLLVIGKCDVVEFWPDGDIYPVEYKHGARNNWLNDNLQLAAQAMCLEEMFGKRVERGAIYHHRSRRRREIIVTQELKQHVKNTLAAIRSMLVSRRMPPPLSDKRCSACSLRDLCQPEALAASAGRSAALVALFDPES